MTVPPLFPSVPAGIPHAALCTANIMHDKHKGGFVCRFRAACPSGRPGDVRPGYGSGRGEGVPELPQGRDGHRETRKNRNRATGNAGRPQDGTGTDCLRCRQVARTDSGFRIHSSGPAAAPSPRPGCCHITLTRCRPSPVPLGLFVRMRCRPLPLCPCPHSCIPAPVKGTALQVVVV